MPLYSEPLPLDSKVGLDATTTRINISLPGVELHDYTNKSTSVMQMMTSCKHNLLQPTGHVMHHQFNVQKLYALPTLYLCVLYLSENKQ